MSIPDNLIITYNRNGKVSHIYEICTEFFCKHGIYVDWRLNGELWEECYYVKGQMHGIRIIYVENDVAEYMYYYENEDVTAIISPYIKDIHNITDHEKTIVALNAGLVL